MTKKGKIILAVFIPLTVFFTSTVIVGIVICGKIFGKKYISVN